MKELPRLETARLVLRPFELADAPAVQRLAGDWAVAATTLNVPHPYEDGMAEEWIGTHRAKFERREQVTLAVILRETGGLIGAMGLVLNLRFERAEVGYWIGKPYWRNGYATEAARAVLKYGFEELKLNRIHATHIARNPASGRVMQKIGMKHEGCLRQHTRRWDRFDDIMCYAILKDEYVRNRQ